MLFRNTEGELVYSIKDATEGPDWVEAIADLLQTPTGQTLKQYRVAAESDDLDELIYRAVNRNAVVQLDGAATLQQLEDSLKVVIGCKMVPKNRVAPVLEEPAPPAPVDPLAGLSGSQKNWATWKQWSNEHNSSECKRRAQAEPDGYGKFFHTNLVREFTNSAGGVADGVVPVIEQSRDASVVVTSEMRSFARAYNLEPSENLRAKGGLVKIGGQEMSYAYFKEMVDKCLAGGVL